MCEDDKVKVKLILSIERDAEEVLRLLMAALSGLVMNGVKVAICIEDEKERE